MCIGLEQLSDGRWKAEVDYIEGAIAYGETEEKALESLYKLLAQLLPGEPLE